MHLLLELTPRTAPSAFVNNRQDRHHTLAHQKVVPGSITYRAPIDQSRYSDCRKASIVTQLQRRR
ncbi:hypothetical protein [Hydrogenophilus thermoluteolus]|uniref:hypothetical protein n=1 Tax=Hydrogenophilus thermoluteolus TaxID=297 RepID=UPI003F66C34E